MLRKGTVLKRNDGKTTGLFILCPERGLDIFTHSMCKYIRAGSSAAAACLHDVTWFMDLGPHSHFASKSWKRKKLEQNHQFMAYFLSNPS